MYAFNQSTSFTIHMLKIFLDIKYFCQMHKLKEVHFETPARDEMFISKPSDYEQEQKTEHTTNLSLQSSNRLMSLFTSTLGALPGFLQIYTDKTKLDTVRYPILTQHDLLCYSRPEMWSSWSNLHNGRSGSV